jgi:hypothetical protein
LIGQGLAEQLENIKRFGLTEEEAVRLLQQKWQWEALAGGGETNAMKLVGQLVKGWQAGVKGGENGS